MLASFEKTPDHLFDAAIHSRTDLVKGVSEVCSRVLPFISTVPTLASFQCVLLPSV